MILMGTMMKVVIISDTCQEFNGIRCYKTGAYYSNSDLKSRIHRDVYRFYYGEIAQGNHIHHKDRNPDNNDIDNLQQMTPEEHAFEHRSDNSRVEWGRKLGRMYQHRTKEWHASDAGAAWHKEHYEKTKEKLHQKIDRACGFCGAIHQTARKNTPISFCSNKCKSAHRRASGVDDIEKECVSCGEPFMSNKYQRAKRCKACVKRAKSQ